MVFLYPYSIPGVPLSTHKVKGVNMEPEHLHDTWSFPLGGDSPALGPGPSYDVSLVTVINGHFVYLQATEGPGLLYFC